MGIQNLGSSLQSYSCLAQGNGSGSALVARNSSNAATESTTSTSATAADPQVSSNQLLQAIQQLNYLVGSGHDLDFSLSIDANTHQAVVSVTDASTGTLIRQLPPAQVLAIANNPSLQPGLLITQQA